MTIEKIAVIGSGVMGLGIACHIANSGTEVLLLDIVPEGADDRSTLAKGAIEKAKKSDPQMLTHKRNTKLITAGNLEDDLDKLAECDWIIEVVLERLDVKQNLYKKIDAVRKEGSIVSSNTSTLPLKVLVDGMGDSFAEDFCITHFFNPPRYMRLLELVRGEHTKREHIDVIREFCDVRLGKGVVDCNDTPGFIANRIGVFWLATALNKAIEMDVPVEVADAVMGRPVGIPKTDVFGLMDLIGIDLLPLIAKSYADTLPSADEFLKIYNEPKVVTNMIADGYTGRKGKGGFYRLNTEGGGKVKEAKNLQTGEDATAHKPRLDSVKAAKKGPRALVEHTDLGGQYAKEVMRDTLWYAASLVGEIAENIHDIDEAMKMGYNWKYGPFELVDKLGADWLVKACEEAGKPVPSILTIANDAPLYTEEDANIHYRRLDGNFSAVAVSKESYMLADVKRGRKPVAKNPSASLWDMGDGVLALEFTSKMNAIDPLIFDMMDKAVELCDSGDYKGLVIANDAENFCVGANIGLALFGANVAAWKLLGDFIKRGQDTFMKLKYANFPVISAPSGMALGGGCEVLLHSDAVVAHTELYTGLVEVGVGIIPGWGGCKEMLYRALDARAKSDRMAAKFGKWFSVIPPVKTLNTMPAIEPAFRNISTAKVAKSAEQARDMMILNDASEIVMNRKRVLPRAKALVLEMAADYTAPETHSIHLPGKTARVALDIAIKGAVKQGIATPHDVTVSTCLGMVLSGGKTDITKELTEQDLLDLEREQFDILLRTPETLDRIEHMLNTGKPLRN